MKLTRSLVCLLLVLALLTAFVSCAGSGSKKTAQTQEKSDSSAQQEEEKKADEKEKTNPGLGGDGIEGPIIDIETGD